MNLVKVFGITTFTLVVGGVAIYVYKEISGILPPTIEQSPPYITPNEMQALQEKNLEKQKMGTWPFISDEDDAKAIVSDNLLSKNYYVMVDGSGSMRVSRCSGNLSKMDAAKNALVAFGESIPAGANLGLSTFDKNGVREIMPLQQFNKNTFDQQVKSIEEGGGTPLKTSITDAYKQLTAQAKKQLGYGEYNLVIVTDGQASSNEDPTRIVETVTAESPVIIHTIGFCIGSDHALNKPGKVLYNQADNTAELEKGLQSVTAESEAFIITDFK